MFRTRLKIFLVLNLFLTVLFFKIPGVFAEAKYNIKEMTPEVQTALDNRRSRFDQLQALKAKGTMGENNHGYVEALGNDSAAKSLAEAENRDRKFIYKTIEQQNGLSDAMETIEKVFAQVQREKANAGDKIQNEDGSWAAK